MGPMHLPCDGKLSVVSHGPRRPKSITHIDKTQVLVFNRRTHGKIPLRWSIISRESPRFKLEGASNTQF